MQGAQFLFLIWSQPQRNMGESTFATFQGLNSILESPRWPIAKKCQAVDGCLELNRCNSHVSAHYLQRGFEHVCLHNCASVV